jgi:hypothetical protein
MRGWRRETDSRAFAKIPGLDERRTGRRKPSSRGWSARRTSEPCVICFFKAVHRYPGVRFGLKSGGSLPWLGKMTYAGAFDVLAPRVGRGASFPCPEPKPRDASSEASRPFAAAAAQGDNNLADKAEILANRRPADLNRLLAQPRP